MRVAVTTMVYNESSDLQIWLRYYGRLFGPEALYVFDHGTTNGSTDNLGNTNRIRIPRDKYDDTQRVAFLTDMQHALLQYNDLVIHTDCDEIIIPDPKLFRNLADYVSRMQTDYICPVGLNVIHFNDLEPPLDLTQRILSQRKYCQFESAYCKPTISKTPLLWSVGCHGCDKPTKIDPNLFLFHFKLKDHDLSIQRLHEWRNEVAWSDRAITAGHGQHLRHDDTAFEQQFFTTPRSLLAAEGERPFEFGEMIHRVESEQYQVGPFYLSNYIRGGISCIPERFKKIV